MKKQNSTSSTDWGLFTDALTKRAGDGWRSRHRLGPLIEAATSAGFRLSPDIWDRFGLNPDDVPEPFPQAHGASTVDSYTMCVRRPLLERMGLPTNTDLLGVDGHDLALAGAQLRGNAAEDIVVSAIAAIEGVHVLSPDEHGLQISGQFGDGTKVKPDVLYTLDQDLIAVEVKSLAGPVLSSLLAAGKLPRRDHMTQAAASGIAFGANFAYLVYVSAENPAQHIEVRITPEDDQWDSVMVTTRVFGVTDRRHRPVAAPTPFIDTPGVRIRQALANYRAAEDRFIATSELPKALPVSSPACTHCPMSGMCESITAMLESSTRDLYGLDDAVGVVPARKLALGRGRAAVAAAAKAAEAGGLPAAEYTLQASPAYVDGDLVSLLMAGRRLLADRRAAQPAA